MTLLVGLALIPASLGVLYLAYAAWLVSVRQQLARYTVTMTRATGDNEQTQIAFNEPDDAKLATRVLAAGAVLQSRMEAHNARTLAFQAEQQALHTERELAKARRGLASVDSLADAASKKGY